MPGEISYLLPFVPMDGTGLEFAAELSRQLIAHSLCGAENDDPSAMSLGAQNLHQFGQLLVWPQYLHGKAISEHQKEQEYTE